MAFCAQLEAAEHVLISFVGGGATACALMDYLTDGYLCTLTISSALNARRNI